MTDQKTPDASAELVPREPQRPAPERPAVAKASTAPVLVKATPPFTVRATEFFWILSFALGAFIIVYLFILRLELLPLISSAAHKVEGARNSETYATAADIIFWTTFGIWVACLFTQLTLLVSFMSRKPRVRWWQFATLLLQLLVMVLASDLVAVGSRGRLLAPLMLGQCALVAVALLFSILPPAMAWSARRYDVNQGPTGPTGGDF